MKTIIITISLLLSIFISNAQYGIGQKEEPSKGQKKANKGQYEEVNSVNKHPYTTFVKTKDDFNIQNEIEIIESILSNPLNPLRTIYKDKIFSSALSSFDPADTAQIGGHIKYTTWGIKNGEYQEYEKDCRKGVSESSIMCKNAAFVYLMGFNQYGRMLRGTGNPLDRDTLKSIHTNLEYTNI